MTAHDLRSLLATLPTLKITAETTPEEATAAPRMLGSLNRCVLGLVRFSGQAPWERHPDDELLHVLDGEVELTLLTDSGLIESPFALARYASCREACGIGRWREIPLR